MSQDQDNIFILQRLRRPSGPISVVLDTDAFNEIDDQYALSYLLLSPDKLRVKALYAAPFHNEKSSSPRDGMEKSYDEILRVLKLCGKEDMCSHAFKGSSGYLPDEKTPVMSDAAAHLAALAKAQPEDEPLYVAAIGAITNVASALLMSPEIARKIVIVFLGGNPLGWTMPEFNMMQDIAAARAVFNSGAPLVQIPCMGVATHLTTTEPELREHIRDKSPLGKYLYDITREAMAHGGSSCWSRVIWDISTIAWLLSEDYVWDRIIPAPIPSYDNGYVAGGARRHFMKAAYYINRDAVFSDLFKKIGGIC